MAFSNVFHFFPSVYDELMKASGCHDYVILGVLMGREESLWSMASVRDREKGFTAELEHRFIARELVYWKVGHVVTVEHRRHILSNYNRVNDVAGRVCDCVAPDTYYINNTFILCYWVLSMWIK